MTTEFASKLSKFGLSENDSAVYLFLLGRGTPFGGSKIAGRLSLHRQYVYTSLQKLIELQLVEQTSSGPRPKYQALPPQQLTHIARKRLQDTEATVRELNVLSAVGANQDFEIYRGTQQIMDFEERLVRELPQSGTQYIIGGGSEAFFTFYGDRYEELAGVSKEHGLHTKYVASPAEAEWLGRAQRGLGSFESRVLAHMPKTAVQTVIRFDTVTFYSFGTPPLVYIIKSKSVYEDYKKFFEMLWGFAGAEGQSFS